MDGDDRADDPTPADGSRTTAVAGDGDSGADLPDPDAVLDAVGFDPERSALTRRQAEVLALRERGARQQDIADLLGTSRANVSSVEASARDNVAKARETIAFAEALSAPVRVTVEPDTDLYDVPKQVYDACDEAGVKVNYTAPELMKVVSDAAGDAVQGRKVRAALLVGVSHDGTVQVRRRA
ncbi:MAG: Tfx family DNA-binding protein [Halolamina sp.]